jgi:hypothetical protein
VAEIDSNPRILSNTFLVVTREVVDACLNTSIPWIWAYETNFVPPAVGTEQYEGRLRVNLHSLFTWFYAVRSEELYSMQYLCEKAQSQSAEDWDVSTIIGVYHRPLVLLDKDSSYQITTYELEKKP